MNHRDTLAVHPWKILVDNMCYNLDDNTFEKFLFFSKDILGRQKYADLSTCMKYVEYFSALEDKFDTLDKAVEHIENVVNAVQFHGELGQTNYRNEIQKYRENMMCYSDKCDKEKQES